MKIDPFPHLQPHRRSPPIVRSARFVTQSHALSGPVANPRAIVIATLIAVAVYAIGRRLSE